MHTIRWMLAGMLVAAGLWGCQSTSSDVASVPPASTVNSRPLMPLPGESIAQSRPMEDPQWTEPQGQAQEPDVMRFDTDATIPQPEPAADRPRAGTEYTVQRGDTLYRIAVQNYGDRRMIEAIMAANPQITDPNKIFVGQTIVLP